VRGPSTDPVLRHGVQPLVDRTGADPRHAAMLAANLFLTMTITLAATRVATVAVATKPDLYLSQTLGVVGAAMTYACLRFCIANGETTLIGLPGLLHLGARLVYLTCLVLDAGELVVLASTDLLVTPMSMMRSCMQLTQTVSLLAALYLSVARKPPPPRPRAERLSPATI